MGFRVADTSENTLIAKETGFESIRVVGTRSQDPLARFVPTQASRWLIFGDEMTGFIAKAPSDRTGTVDLESEDPFSYIDI